MISRVLQTRTWVMDPNLGYKSLGTGRGPLLVGFRYLELEALEVSLGFRV